MADEVAAKKGGGSKGTSLLVKKESKEEDMKRESDSSPVGTECSPTPGPMRKNHRVKLVSFMETQVEEGEEV